MITSGFSKGITYGQLCSQWGVIETIIDKGRQGAESLKSVSEFIKKNTELFVREKRPVVRSDSFRKKVRHLPGHKSWIDKEIVNSESIKTGTNFLSHLAKLSAQINGRGTAYYIQNFAIEDEATRIEIAKLCAHQNGGRTAKYIQNFAIENELDRIEIAKICAQQDGENTANYLQNFAIRNQAARGEIAQICAKQNGWAFFYLHNFAIEDEVSKVKIAKICAKQNGRSIAYFIKKFSIRDEDALINIAEICARQDGRGTAEFVENFAIREESVRIRIALLCAKQNADGTAANIENFAIEDESARLKIAHCCARRKGMRTAYYFKKFAIKNEADRIKIAKLCARQNEWFTAGHIRNFAIGDEEARIKIAKACAGSAAAAFVENFTIKNTHTLYQLFLDCIKADPKALYHRFSFASHLPKEILEILENLEVLKEEAPEDSRRRKLFEKIPCLIEALPTSRENQNTILNMSSKIQELPPHAQNPAGLWLISSILLMREMKADEIEWLLERGIWSELALLKEPRLRVSLSSGLHTLSVDRERRRLWDNFLCGVRGGEGHRGLMLLAIPFFNLQLQGIDGSKLFSVAMSLSSFQKKKESRFRNVNHVKNFIYTMHSLASSVELTPQQKERGFNRIFFKRGSVNAMHNDEALISKNLIAAKGLMQLKNMQWPNAKNLNVLFRSCLEKLIPLGQYKGDISARYEEFFGNTCRKPGGLLIYAAGLKTLREPALLSCLGDFVVSVMDNTFKNKRYKITHNPHLAKIAENEGLLSKWREEIKVNIIPEENSETKVDPELWLHTKLIMDKRLSLEALPYLSSYLNASTFLERNLTFSALIEEIKQSMNLEKKEHLRKQLELEKKKIKEVETNLKTYKGNEEETRKLSQEKRKTEKSLEALKQKLHSLSASTVKDPVVVNLNLQKACLRFVKLGKNADKKILIQHLEEMDAALHQVEYNSGFGVSHFANDVKGLIKAFRDEAENAENKKHLQAVFTDDPIDLLLCGTEVDSCQKLDGDPKNNKGLLGYLIDGKNRLLAIKNGDRIVARCMLRLLWDGTQPVIYRDRFYPDQIFSTHKEALEVLAKQVAQKMAVPLACGDPCLLYNQTLHALGGPAPYEYCDSDGARGVHKDGHYTFQAKILE